MAENIEIFSLAIYNYTGQDKVTIYEKKGMGIGVKKILSLILAAVMLMAVLPGVGAFAAEVVEQSDDKDTFNGHQYQILSGDMSMWEDANLYCESLGGHLATITSKEENDFLFNFMLNKGYENAYFGLTDAYEEGNWEWINGEVFAYSNWHSGEPNNQGNTEHYAMFYYKFSDGTWNDGDFGGQTLNGEKNFICEWDNNESAFTKNKDGWAIANAQESFGYPDGYRIPISRYRKTFGISLSSLFLGGLQHIPEWGGNCFGLSLLSIAQYNNQIDLTDYFPDRNEDGLYDFGYNSIQNIKRNGRSGSIFSVADNEEIIEVIECALISQNSQEIKKAEVFAGDKKYSQLLNYLNGDNARPLLVTLSFGIGGHAMVITNDEKPVELTNSPGWYYIPLYDCNQPANSTLLKNPYKWYTQEDSYLLIDTKSGKWQYWRDGSAQHGGDYSFLFDKYIRFYDVSKLEEDFFNKALTLWGNIIKLDFSGNDITITDDKDNILFKAVDGEIEYIDERCDYSPSFAKLNSDNYLSGTIELPVDKFNCSINNGEIAAWSEESLLSVSTKGKNDVVVDVENCSITNNSVSASDLYVSLQEGVTDEYVAISLSGQTSRGKTLSLAIDDGKVSSSGTEDGEFNVVAETSEKNKAYNKLTLSEIDGIQINNTSNNNDETSFGSEVSDWAKEEIEEAYKEDLIPEVLIGEDLTKKIDRAEFASISVQLYEELSGNRASDNKNPFMDIKGSKCFDEIVKAYNLGITAGVTDNTFEPETLITREQLATMLCRTIKKYSFDDWSLDRDGEYYLDTSGVPLFEDDADISEYAKPSVYYMTKFGIIKGIDDTHFAPKNTTSAQEAMGYAMATREQAIALSLRIFKLSDIW